MLLRNLDSAHGHCNGTKYIIEEIRQHVISAKVATGPCEGDHIFIPRIPLAPSDTEFPFSMKRIQFPLKPSFGITSNRSQGQTLERIGILLKTKEFFAHGQLYVSLGRVKSKNNVRVLLPDDCNVTSNIVYKEVFS